RPARLMLRDRQFFVFYSSADHPVLHSFPTRRSSDLPAYRNVVLERPPAHAQPVTRLHRFRPLGAGAVELDLAAVDGLRRQGPRLEEARGPEPSVQANRAFSLHLSALSFRSKPASIRFT